MSCNASLSEEHAASSLFLLLLVFLSSSTHHFVYDANNGVILQQIDPGVMIFPS